MTYGPAIKYEGGVYVWQKQKSTVQCKCGCGEFITNRAAKLLANGKENGGYCKGHRYKGKNLPLTTCLKMSENHADVSGKNNPNYGKGLFGEDNPNWQGGKVLRYGKGKNHPNANTVQDFTFRKEIKERDGKCILCDNKTRLECHHIKSWINHEELRFDPSNCITLCKSCHVRADNAHHKDRIKPMLLAYIDSLAVN